MLCQPLSSTYKGAHTQACWQKRVQPYPPTGSLSSLQKPYLHTGSLSLLQQQNSYDLKGLPTWTLRLSSATWAMRSALELRTVVSSASTAASRVVNSSSRRCSSSTSFFSAGSSGAGTAPAETAPPQVTISMHTWHPIPCHTHSGRSDSASRKACSGEEKEFTR